MRVGSHFVTMHLDEGVEVARVARWGRVGQPTGGVC